VAKANHWNGCGLGSDGRRRLRDVVVFKERVMKPKKYISKLYDLIHKMNEEGLINKPDKYVAISDLEISIHELEKAFERDIKS